MTRHAWTAAETDAVGRWHRCRTCGAVALGPFSSDDFNRPESQDHWLARLQNALVDPDCDVEVVRRVLRM